jgi:hypothetical protein
VKGKRIVVYSDPSIRMNFQGQGHDSSDRVLAWQSGGPEFKPQYCLPPKEFPVLKLTEY